VTSRFAKALKFLFSSAWRSLHSSLIVSRIRISTMSNPLIQQKLSERDSLLQSASSLVQFSTSIESDLPYLSADATQIIERIQKGEWTAKEVLEAYIRSSKRSQERVNCLVSTIVSIILKFFIEIESRLIVNLLTNLRLKYYMNQLFEKLKNLMIILKSIKSW
jgi:hypothetical protein